MFRSCTDDIMIDSLKKKKKKKKKYLQHRMCFTDPLFFPQSAEPILHPTFHPLPLHLHP